MQGHIPWARPTLWGNERKYADDSLESLWISGGPYVDRLEKRLSGILGRRHALTTSNGTTALLLSYLAVGLQPGDEVIVPGFAFMAAANMAIHMKAKPVFAEVDPGTWCITGSEIERRLTPRTRAIVAVHTYGNVCNMDEIVQAADRRGIAVIEDCAESLFSRYDGRYCGGFGYIATFSFHATKTITTGEGGLTATDDDKARETMVLYRSHGLRERGRYDHEVPGYNFRLTNVQAALGCAQLEHYEAIVRERKRVHRRYGEHLAGQGGVTPQEFDPRVDPVLWAFALKLDPRAFPQGRDMVVRQLGERGIETRPGFTASSLLKIYDAHRLPVCEGLSASVISLPSFPGLTDEQVQLISAELLRLKR